MTARKDSLYEHLFPFTTVMKLRVVDNFDGESLNERWREVNVQGVGTFAMDDAVDGGFAITAASAIGDMSVIDFNLIRQYDQAKSTIIGVIKNDNVASIDNTSWMGFIENPNFIVASSNYRGFELQTNSGVIRIRTSNGTSQSTTNGITTNSGVYIQGKLVNISANSKLFVNDALEATKTDLLGTGKGNPEYGTRTINDPTKSQITYLEAFNT